MTKMTDEEMAEQFADNINGLELTCSLLSAKDKSHAYRLGRYDGFLAGLSAGKPQWHDLRKDPTDLPKEKVDVYILDSQGKVDVKHLEWNKEWWGNGTYYSLTAVTHWKEIVLPEEK